LHGKLGVDPANLAINPAKKHQDADISFIFHTWAPRSRSCCDDGSPATCASVSAEGEDPKTPIRLHDATGYI